MAETIHIDPAATKEAKYRGLAPQWEALVSGETDAYAVMANTAAALKETFDWLWVGFYIVRENELVLGPFQGPVACFRISKDKGVCGTAWSSNACIIVPDVDAFPGHIACSSQSRSEIVVPVRNSNGAVVAVLDIDSTELNHFHDMDKAFLEPICNSIGALLN